jgi:co-chaperonin GroES (HSP10)
MNEYYFDSFVKDKNAWQQNDLQEILETFENLEIKPKGYNIAIIPFNLSTEAQSELAHTQNKSGLYIPQNSQALFGDSMERVNQVGLLVSIGELAYSDKNNPYCSVGDWVLFSGIKANQAKIKKYHVIFCADTNIIATINDPLAISKHYI